MTTDLGGGPSAVAEARHVLAAHLLRWELPLLVPDAQLLVSELVTNAVLHARGDVTLILAVADGTLEVGVTDRSPQLPRPRGRTSRPLAGPLAADWWAEGGRGLRMVDLVSDEWGVSALDDGKQVWYRLGVGPDWPHLTDCPCGGDDLGRMHLQSGHDAVSAPGPWDL